MRIRVDWKGPPGRIPLDYVYRGPPEPFFLAPKAVEQSTFIGMVSVWENYLVGDPWVFIWGRADYKDIFKRPPFVEWCYHVRFDRHDGKNLRVSFIQCGEHNRRLRRPKPLARISHTPKGFQHEITLRKDSNLELQLRIEPLPSSAMKEAATRKRCSF